MDSQTARSLMRSAEKISLKPDLSLDKVSDHLSMHHLPGAPVTNDQQELIGYISEFDCLRQLMQSSYYCDNTALAEDVMSTELIFSSPNITIMDLASSMNKDKINVMPIVENGKLVGAVSRGDVMRALVKDMESCKIPV